MKNIAIILSGGVGSRMGSEIPKQYIEIGGKSVISYCLEQFANHRRIDAVIIALATEWRPFVSDLPVLKTMRQPLYFANQGETRQHSIYNALKCAKEQGYNDEDIVIIHDAARPMVDSEIIDDCLNGCKLYDGAIASIDVKDTIYVGDDKNCIVNVPLRRTLHAGQTPEAFKLGKYIAIHDRASYEQISAVTGGAEFAYREGMKIYLSKGKEGNLKLTTPEDILRFETFLRHDKQ